MADPKPLWLLMQDAVINAPPPLHSPAGSIAAAQLRAIADAVENLDPPECPVSHLGSIEYPSGFDHGAQAGLYAVVAWLRVAAVEAESGGSSDG